MGQTTAMKAWTLICLISAGTLLTAGCRGAAYKLMLDASYDADVALISPEELEQLMDGGTVVLLDTRSPAEYEVSHLRGAILIAYDGVTERELMRFPRDAQIVVYCAVGFRSETIGAQMRDLGYANIQNLYGGIFNWVNENRPVVAGLETMTRRVHGYSPFWAFWISNPEIEIVY